MLRKGGRTNCLEGAERVSKDDWPTYIILQNEINSKSSAYTSAVNILALSLIRKTTKTGDLTMEEPTYDTVLGPSVKNLAYPPCLLSNSRNT